MRRLLSAFLFLAVGSAGCDKADNKQPDPGPPPPAPEATAPVPTTPEAPAPGPTAPKLAPPHQPGPAYFGVDGAGLYQLVDGKITQVIAYQYPFGAVVVDAKGVVYAAAIGGMWRIEPGKQPEKISKDAGLHLQAVELGPDGVVWGTDAREVRRWDGAWTVEPAATFDGELLGDLTVDHEGRTWVVSTHALYRLDGASWTKIDGTFTGNKEPFFGAIATAADGAVYVTAMPGTFVFRGGAWSELDLGDGFLRLDELVAGPAGHIAASGGVGDLVTIAPGDRVKQRDIEGTAKAHRADVLAVDGQGRAWVTSDNGLVVLGADGELLQQWLPGTVEGVTGAITALAVVDDGPALPELRAAVTGHITGKILRGGRAVEGAAIQLCNSPLSMFQKLPCESASFTAEATTGADGTFLLQNVPVGTYGFAIKPDAQWRILIGGSCCNELQAGQTYDVGSVSIDS